MPVDCDERRLAVHAARQQGGQLLLRIIEFCASSPKAGSPESGSPVPVWATGTGARHSRLQISSLHLKASDPAHSVIRIAIAIEIELQAGGI
jgi:hypothetical protein